MHSSVKALVLRSVDYKETNKILTLLTAEDGKVTASAQGSRKRGSALAAPTQLLTYADMVLFEYRGRWSVKEAVIERQFRGVEQDVERLSLGCYFAEITELLAVEGMPAPELLSLILNSLHVLDRRPDKPLELVKAAFELKAMCLAGYEPILDACAVCGQEEPEEARFHLREGVLHCAQCRGEVGDGISMPLGPAALRAMRHIVYGPPKRLFSFQLDTPSLRQLSDLCEAYLMTQLERGFSTLDFFKQLHQPMQ